MGSQCDRPILGLDIRHAGLALVAGDRILVLLRAQGEHSGTWGLPAGTVKPGENPYAAAVRETREEIGSCPTHEVVGRWSKDGFAAYACSVPQPTPVSLNQEHRGAVWADKAWLEENQADLHPGMKPLLTALSARYGWMKI